MNEDLILDRLANNIIDYTIQTRERVYNNVREDMVNYYWNVGRMIVEEEQGGDITPEYGRKLYLELAKRLTKQMGKGYSRSNLFNMRNFYITYPIVQTYGRLSWSHFCELIGIKDENERKFYEKETVNSKWSTRELGRQIESGLYQRLLLSDGKANKEKVLQLAKEGQVIERPKDIIKEPYVFEFLGIKEEKPLLEKDLEYKLIRQLEDFLLELGKGFMFVGSQQRITIDNTHYYIDMVFYNKILKCYVLIDLKMGKLKPENMGQMNMYLNYYETEVNDVGDNKPIGIILCAKKDNVVAEYSLGGINNNLFASNYTYYMPNKDELIAQVEKVINENEEDEK